MIQDIVDLECPTPSGQIRLKVGSFGAAIRMFSCNGSHLIEPVADNQVLTGSVNSVLAPWANRVAGGQWVQRGKSYILPINDVARNAANHGLLLDHPFEIAEQSENSVELNAIVPKFDGYPFDVAISVEYSIDSNGLTVLHRAENLGAEPAPLVFGAHPYLRFGTYETAKLRISSSAQTYLQTDNNLIPFAKVATRGTEYDLQAGVAVGELNLDTCFTDLSFDESGKAFTFLRNSMGQGSAFWQDSNFKYQMIYVEHNSAISATGGTVIAIEPQTGPANAFNSAEDLIWLQPGQMTEASWGIGVNY